MPSPAASTTLPFARAPAPAPATVTEADAVLSDVSGSLKFEETVAVLLMTAPGAADASTVAAIEAPSVAPTASVGKVTVRLLPVPPHAPRGESHEAKVRPAGSASLTVKLPAAAPDLFV